MIDLGSRDLAKMIGDFMSCSTFFRKAGPQRLEAEKELTSSVWATQASPREMDLMRKLFYTPTGPSVRTEVLMGAPCGNA